MTDQEIKDRVEGWNWNLSIFEIYDEVKDMGKYGYGGGNASDHEDLTRLLNHAYNYFNYDPMIKELMSFLAVEITEESLCEEHGRKDLTTAS
jgi:hypothetical protein